MKRIDIIIFIFFIITALFGSIVTQVNAEPSFGQQIDQQLQDLTSYAQEANFVLSLYMQGKTTYAYTQTQINAINENVLSFYTKYQTTKVDNSQIKTAQQLDQAIFTFSLHLKQVDQTNGNKNDIKTIQNNIKKDQMILENIK